MTKLTKQGVRDLSPVSQVVCPWCEAVGTTQKHRKLDGECHRAYGDYVAAKISGELDHHEEET